VPDGDQFFGLSKRGSRQIMACLRADSDDPIRASGSQPKETLPSQISGPGNDPMTRADYGASSRQTRCNGPNRRGDDVVAMHHIWTQVAKCLIDPAGQL